MIVIYYCFAGAHASVVASAIHCGLLPGDRVPQNAEIAKLRYYDFAPPEKVGRLYYMGDDEYGNHIYFMGMWSRRAQVSAAIKGLLDAAGIAKGAYFLQDAFPLINFSTKLGGLLSKRCRLTGIGRTITIWGIKRRYSEFLSLVDNVKHRLRDDFPG